MAEEQPPTPTPEKTPVVVIAIDASDQAEMAVNYYIEHCHKAKNSIVILHVVELPDMEHARQVYLSPAALAQIWQEETEKAEVLKKKFQELLSGTGITKMKFRIESGLKPGQVITNTAVDEKATMVVMGTRGMGKLRRTLLGSVSDYVIHHASCPIVVCRQGCD